MTSFRPTPSTTASDADTKRLQSRDSLMLMARLRFPDRNTDFQDVRVRNLSEGGMMVELTDPVDIGDIVELEMRGVGRLRGRIAWWTDGRAGIALDAPIDPQKARKPVGQGTHTPVYAKPIIARIR